MTCFGTCKCSTYRLFEISHWNLFCINKIEISFCRHMGTVTDRRTFLFCYSISWAETGAKSRRSILKMYAVHKARYLYVRVRVHCVWALLVWWELKYCFSAKTIVFKQALYIILPVKTEMKCYLNNLTKNERKLQGYCRPSWTNNRFNNKPFIRTMLN